jgi:hypothetical protein
MQLMEIGNEAKYDVLSAGPVYRVRSLLWYEIRIPSSGKIEDKIANC